MIDAIDFTSVSSITSLAACKQACLSTSSFNWNGCLAGYFDSASNACIIYDRKQSSNPKYT
jgi:hypothetical protein